MPSGPRESGEDSAARPTPEQRMLDRVMRIGGALVLVGLLTTAVIVVLHLTGRQTPGTWAYLVAMLAPAGFAAILLAMLAVAVRRRRATLADGSSDRAGADRD